MKIIDISMPVSHDMPVYKAREEKRPHISVQSSFSDASVYESRIDMNMHTGTHIDAPMHIFEDGGTIEKLDLSKVITRSRVLDFQNAENSISRELLETKTIEKGDFVLLKTKNSASDILEGEFVFLDKSGAEYLKEKEVSGVGIDALGIERSQPGHETHKLLLGSGIIILEGLRLDGVSEAEYLLLAAPVLFKGAEAAPARAVLIQED